MYLRCINKATKSPCPSITYQKATIPRHRAYQTSLRFMHHYSHSNGFHNRHIMALSVALGLSLSSFTLNQQNKHTKACGIMAMVSNEEVVSYLLEGLTVLQNRGYDSAGIATVSQSQMSSQLSVTKYASRGSTSDSLELLQLNCPHNHTNDVCGIAHTRWATHGAKTDANAHPHCDFGNRIAIVHNGTINNCAELKQELKDKGIEFLSETDTEVIAHLIGYYIDELQSKNNNKNPVKDEDITELALELALDRLDGSWGIAMISKFSPDRIYAARHGSPLMIGLDPDKKRHFIASEHSAFARYTNQFLTLNDNEVAIVTAEGISIEDAHSRIKTAQFNKEDFISSPDPYPNWTLKEINEQPAAISRALQFGSRLSYDDKVILGGLTEKRELLEPITNLIMTGCGTSLNAALYGQRLMQYVKAFDTVTCVDAAEVTADTYPSGNDTKERTAVLAISQSGETKDVIDALQIADAFSIQIFSIVNTVGSAIARMTNLGVYCYAGRENAVASTKAFTSQVTVLSLIAGWFAQKKHINNQRCKKLIDALHRLPTYIGVTIAHCKDASMAIAEELYTADHMFVLGKGFAESIAYEGALKIKEITYIHAEGYSGGALKHGPFALIDKNIPVIMIILDDEHGKIMVTNAHEIEARHGKMVYITDNPKMLDGLNQKDRVITIPKNGPLTALLSVIPLQMIAYYIAMKKGINPDKPKNLAKAVTVV